MKYKNKGFWFNFNRTKFMQYINYLNLLQWYSTKNGKRCITNYVVDIAIKESFITKEKGEKFRKKHKLALIRNRASIS